jgi:hypothetical protein
MEMRVPPADARAAIWEKMLKKNKIRMKPEEIKELSTAYELPPSFADSAVRTAKIVRDKTAVKLTLDSLMEAQDAAPKAPESDEKAPFHIGLLNSDTNLEKLVDRISSKGKTRFSLCLHGHPGTGKSEFVRHLAETVKMPVLQKRASDLQSMYVGQTEQNIARAFREVAAKKMFLVLDEADSFLQDRRAAVRSWEVSQANELLNWMESHPLPFACTTNIIEKLDRASLRRFTFSVRLKYMTKRQTALAFKHFFGWSAKFPWNILLPVTSPWLPRKLTTSDLTPSRTLLSCSELSQSPRRSTRSRSVFKPARRKTPLTRVNSAGAGFVVKSKACRPAPENWQRAESYCQGQIEEQPRHILKQRPPSACQLAQTSLSPLSGHFALLKG